MPLPTGSLLTDLHWWFDARDITPVADGTTVTTWADSTGNGHTATRNSGISTGNAVYYSGQYNGNPALTFTNARFDIASVGSIPATDEHSFFAICRLSSTSTDQNIIGDSGLNWRFGATNGSVRYNSVFNGGFGPGSIGTAAIDTTWHKPALTYDGVHSATGFYLEGVNDPSSVATGALNYSPPAWLCGTSIGEFFNGQILLIGYWNRILTSTELSDLAPIAPPHPTPRIFIVT